MHTKKRAAMGGLFEIQRTDGKFDGFHGRLLRFRLCTKQKGKNESASEEKEKEKDNVKPMHTNKFGGKEMRGIHGGVAATMPNNVRSGTFGTDLVEVQLPSRPRRWPQKPRAWEASSISSYQYIEKNV